MECAAPCASLSTGAVTQYMSLFFNYLSVAQCSLSSPDKWPEDYGEIALQRGFQKYDFIVVGAGSAGSVVANRLSENPNWNILLIEAGGDPPIESVIPMLAAGFYRSQYDWQYEIEKSNTHSIYAGYWPRGKLLGGSSSTNGLLYARGNNDDYNNWEALGNPTWGWENVLSYFKKSEMNLNEEIADANGGFYHSVTGPMAVDLITNGNPWNDDIIAAAQEMGFKFLKDVNANEHIGFNYAQRTMRSGVRESTATAFLVPIKNRTNLHIVKNTQVLNLEVNRQGAVTGVRMNLQGKREIMAYADKEVILSAGTINTPQLLMLSGIGPAEHLQSLQIPLIRDLPVGKNLQDHPLVPLVIQWDKSTAQELPPTQMLKEIFKYLTDRTGELLTHTTFQTFGYFNPVNTSSPYQTYQMAFSKGDAAFVTQSLPYFGFNDEISAFIGSLAKDSNLLIVYASLQTAQSRGEILLRNTDPTAKPRIFANYLDVKSDTNELIQAIRLYSKFLATESFRKHEAELIRIPISECDTLTYDSDEYWACYCRYLTTTTFHPVGTAKMGPDSDPTAVVDSRLRVRGVEGLRIIDASIMPKIPRGNTNAPTIMIAEKGADFVKEDWSTRVMTASPTHPTTNSTISSTIRSTSTTTSPTTNSTTRPTTTIPTTSPTIRTIIRTVNSRGRPRLTAQELQEQKDRSYLQEGLDWFRKQDFFNYIF